MTDRHSTRTRFSRLCLKLLCAALVAELLLRMVSGMFPLVHTALRPWEQPVVDRFIPDPILYRRGNPDIEEHDALGFRNESVARTCDIVVIGDSNSYGHMVRPSEAWPSVLQQRTELRVYNMALSAIGPVQYRELVRLAGDHNPRLVIVCIYLGNDILGAFNSAYRLRRPGSDLRGRYISPAVLHSWTNTPVALEYNKGKFERPLAPPSSSKSFILSIVEYSELATLLRAVRFRAVHWYLGLNKAGRAWNRWKTWADQSSELTLHEAGNVRTVLNPTNRRAALDPSQSKIEEGVHVTLRAIDSMRDICVDYGAELMIAILPTKETVFEPFVARPKDPILLELSRAEEIIRRRISTRLRSQNIPCVDLLQHLRDAIEQGTNPYFESDNTHISVVGHRTVAAALEETERVRRIGATSTRSLDPGQQAQARNPTPSQ